MAELAASIIGIVSAGTKVTFVLTQLATDVGSAGKEARMIGNEIRSFCAVVKTLGETLEKVQSSQYYAHCAEMTKDMTDASLEMFTEVLNASESVRTMARGKDGKFGLVGRVQWAVFQKPKITLLRAALEAYKSNLALMLGTLNTAEKATRKLGLEDSAEATVENEQDWTILQSLEKEHRASLIVVEKVHRQGQQHTTTGAEQTDLHEDVPDSTAPPQNPSNVGISSLRSSDTESLVNSARAEIASFRSSLSRASTFDSDIIHEQVSRYSDRLSRLMSEDQLRISQRWSNDPSLSSYDQGFSQPQTSSWTFEPLPRMHNSPHPLNQSGTGYPEVTPTPEFPSLEPHTRPSQPVSPHPPTPTSGQRSSILSDTFYGIVRTWLMEKSREERRVILGTLMNEVCVEPPKSPNQEDAQAVRSHSPQSRVKGMEKTSPPLKVEHIKKPGHDTTAQYRRQAREIISLVKTQVQESDAKTKAAKAAGTMPFNENPHLTIDLGHQGISNLPPEIIDVISRNLERLSLSHNSLVHLPRSMTLCTSLRYLNLRYNQFDTIPTTVLELSSLEILDMSKNRLKSIPETLSKLGSLKVLSVEKNEIQRLPYALGKMEKLQLLKYAGNPIAFPAAEMVEAWMSERPSPRTPKHDDETDMEYHKTTCVKQYMRTLKHSRRDRLSGLSKPAKVTRSSRFPVVPVQHPSPFETTTYLKPFDSPSRNSLEFARSLSKASPSLLEYMESESDNELPSASPMPLSEPHSSRHTSPLSATNSQKVKDIWASTSSARDSGREPMLSATTILPAPSHQRFHSQNLPTRTKPMLSPSVDTAHRRHSYLDTPDQMYKRNSMLLHPSLDAYTMNPLGEKQGDDNAFSREDELFYLQLHS